MDESTAEPYLHVKNVGDRFEITGTPTCSFGHRLPRLASAGSDGVFAEWSWDGSRLRVRNDRYGFYPVYYFARENEIAISTSILRLLDEGAPQDFDDGGLAAFLRLGCFIGEDTPFRAIRALPPGAMFEWSGGQPQVSGQYAIAKPQSMSRDEAIDSYISLFRAAIGRRLPSTGDFVVPLSGGADSRHILLELCRAGYKPKFCVTVRFYPPRPNGDAEIAPELAKALQVEHVVLDQRESKFRAELTKNIKTNFCTADLSWPMVMGAYLNGKTEVIYDGIGGDVLSTVFTRDAVQNVELLDLFDAGRLAEVAERMFGYQEVMLSRLLAPDTYRRFSRELAMDRLLAELRKHVNAPNPLSSVHFWNWTRREVALIPCRMLNVDTVYCPYVDHDLYDFLASLPASMFFDGLFREDAIRRAYPNYANIPFYTISHGLKRREDRVHYRQFARQLSWFTVCQGRSGLVNQTFLVPRLLRRSVDGHRRMESTYPSLALYLMQLERVQS